MKASMLAALALLIVSPACSGGEGFPDARVYQDDFAGDASTHPGFRDAACVDGTTSGTSGGGCGDPDAPDASVPDASPPDATPCDEVTFAYADEQVSSVWVSGTFTDPEWAEEPPAALELADLGGGNWELTTRVGAGYHEYKLILDGDEWITDPENPDDPVDDDRGGYNSVLVLCD